MILSFGVGDGSGKWEILSEWNSTKFGNTNYSTKIFI